jgi:hypothetical protein
MPIDDFPFHIVKNPSAITATTIGLAFSPTLDGFGMSSQDELSGS